MSYEVKYIGYVELEIVQRISQQLFTVRRRNARASLA